MALNQEGQIPAEQRPSALKTKATASLGSSPLRKSPRAGESESSLEESLEKPPGGSEVDLDKLCEAGDVKGIFKELLKEMRVNSTSVVELAVSVNNFKNELAVLSSEIAGCITDNIE